MNSNSARSYLLVQWRLFDLEFYDSSISFRKFRIDYCVLSPENHRLVNLALELDLQFDGLQKESVPDPFYRSRFPQAPAEATLFSHPIYDFGNCIRPLLEILALHR